MSKRILWIGIFWFFIFEIASRMTLGVPSVLESLVRVENSALWRIRWVMRHHAGVLGSDIRYTFDQYDRFLGWTLQPNLKNLVCFKDKILNSNSQGIRGTREFSEGAHPGIFRIVILGDSYTFGSEVNDEDTWPAFLQKKLGSAVVEVINLAVQGYGHDQMLLRLEKEGLKYQPDLVILGFAPVDRVRNLLEFRDYAKPRFVRNRFTKSFELKHLPVPEPSEVLKQDIFRSRFLDLLSGVWDAVKIRFGLRQKEEERVTAYILNGMRQRVEDAGSRLAVLYLPKRTELMPDAKEAPEARWIEKFAKRESLLFCDPRTELSKILQSRERPDWYGHYDPELNEKVAEVMTDCLGKQGWIS